MTPIAVHERAPYGSLPLVLEPVVAPSLGGFLEWAAAERDSLRAKLCSHGGVLLRGFPVRSTEDFAAVLPALEPTPLAYVGGNSPRRSLAANVYNSSDFPAKFQLVEHNEQSSLMRGWPARIVFCCITPATTGGETPIVDCRRVLARLGPELRELFREKKIMYWRNFLPPDREASDVSSFWHHSFGTRDKAEVDKIVGKTCTKFGWRDNGELWTQQIVDIVTEHPTTGEAVWFSNLGTFHTHCFFKRNHLPSRKPATTPTRHGTFGDGSEIDEAILDRIDDALVAEQVVFPWQKGDVLILDNVLVAHGRRAFTGPREILVGMGAQK